MKIFIKLIFLSLLIFTSCKSSNENLILGSWKGTCKNRAISNFKARYCEMEFSEDGKFFTRQSDIENIELDSPIIKDYKIVGDSLITNFKGRKDSYFIEFISENKLVLNMKLGSLNDFYYELNK
jgi:hypothetical protein